MVIGIFTDTFFPEINGVATSVMMLKGELERLGHKAYVITSSNPALSKDEDMPGVYRLPSAPFLFLPSRRMAVFYNKQVASRIHRLGLDLVHTNTEFSLGIFGKLVASMLGIPVVHTFHTLYEDYVHYVTKGFFANASRQMVMKISRGYCNSCQSIVAPTEKTKDILLSYGVARPISVAPTGIDLSRFAPSADDAGERAALRSKLGIPQEDKVLLYVGRLAKEKSVDAVMRAMRALSAKRRDITFLLVGDGPCRQELAAMASDGGFEGKAVFAGERPWTDMPGFYKAGDVFVSASRSETQGLTFIEAMAAGLPVISARDRSIEDIVVDGKTGGLFDLESEIPDKLLPILDDGELRAALSRNALAIAKGYSAASFAGKVERVYADAICASKAAEAESGESVTRMFGKKTLRRIIM